MKKKISILSIIIWIITIIMSLPINYFNMIKINKNDSPGNNEVKIISAEEAKIYENHFLSHSNFKPTGYFLEQNIKYVITFNSLPIRGTKIAVGSWDDSWEEHWEITGSGKWEINQGFDERYLDSDSMEIQIVFVKDGPLYIVDSNMTDLQIVMINEYSNNLVMKIPTFKLFETNQNEFVKEIIMTNLPFVELVSKHFFATIHTKIFSQFINNICDLNKILEGWDNSWIKYNWVHGLDENATGVHKKYPHYIHIVSSNILIDTRTTALVKNGHIIFSDEISKPFSSLKKIFKLNSSVFWHELGHVFQNFSYVWNNNLIEITNEIAHTYMVEELYFWNFNKWIWNSASAIKRYLSIPDPYKNYDSLNYWKDTQLMLSMFWQLKMAFGKNFYPLLNQRYRIIDTTEPGKFNTKNEKKQNFIEITSWISKYNLIPFFEKWGIWPSLETIENINSYKLKTLTVPIWNNIVLEETRKNPIVQEELKLHNN